MRKPGLMTRFTRTVGVLGLIVGGFGCGSNQGSETPVAESVPEARPAATSGAGAPGVSSGTDMPGAPLAADAQPADAQPADTQPAAAKPEASINGKWVVTQAAHKNDVGVMFNFQQGGTCMLSKQGAPEVITTRYTLKGSQLDMKVSKPAAKGKPAQTESVMAGAVTVKGNEMTIDVKSSAFSKPQLLKLKRG